MLQAKHVRKIQIKLVESIRPQAHSDIIYDKIDTYGLEPDIVIEAKLKEQAIFNYGKKIIK